MLLNSIQFAVFFSVVFVLYWFLQRRHFKMQNGLILAASYLFYGLWDWRFAGLLLISSILDFLIGTRMGRAEGDKRKLLLWLSVALNVLLLGFFKYFNFFAESLAGLLNLFGLQSGIRTLQIILPVGISFYTFKKLSYTIDVYRNRIEPTRDPVAFLAFVAFFPQILAGPIDRGSTLLPQFLKKREFSDPLARDGLRQILAGLMKKMILADNLLPLVNELFSNHGDYDSLSLIIGVFFAAMQLYFDFAGYSDIAIGTGKLLGFKLARNFACPYFSRDIAEFWRRWHISLSSWLRDYLYVPMCGKRPSRAKRGFFIVVTFTICGLWHEAAWTYVFWGFLHGLYFLPMTLRKRHPRFIGTPGKGRVLPTFRDLKGMIITFTLTSFGWIFFMASSFREAFGIVGGVFSSPVAGTGLSLYLPMLGASLLFLVIEWMQRTKEHFLQIERLHVALRWFLYILCILSIIVFGAFGSNEFVYTQF